MNLELNLLESFLVLSDVQHFGEASRRLNISQPALSKQIKRLEDRLGGVLIDRDTRHFALTPAGEVLRESAGSLLRQTELAERRVRLALDGKAGTLRIGFGIANLSAGLGRLLRDFRIAFPEVRIELKDMSTPAQLKALNEDEIDVGFVRLPVANQNLATVPYLRERLMIAHLEEWTEKLRDGLQALANEPFVALKSEISTSFRAHLLATCRAAGFTPTIVQEASEVLTLLHLVGSGFGVALVPESSCQMTVPHVAFSDTLLGEASWDIGLVYHRGSTNSLLLEFVAAAQRGHPLPT